MTKPHRLEVALRVKTWEGVLLSEHVIRGDRVELLNYFPSGGVSAHLEIGLDAFITEIEKLRLSEPTP